MTNDECRPLTSATPLLGVDDHQRIVCLNAAAEELLGVRAEHVRGRFCYEILDGLDVFGNRYCVPNCPVHCSRVRRESAHPFELTVAGPRGRVRVQIHSLHLQGEAGLHFLVLAPLDAPNGAAVRSVRLPVVPPAPPAVRAPAAPSPPRGSELLEPLTAREAEVLDQIARGAATAQIARALSIAEATVRNHVQRILQKLGAHSRLEAVAIARDAGLL